MIGFAVRNLKVFFKDKSAVFFSLLAVFIIIGLYALFLGDVWTQSFSDYPDARSLMDSWIMAGVLAVTSFTTTMGAYGTMIDDKVKKINKDFIVSPIRPVSLVGGYILSALIIGIVMSLVTLLLAEIYMVVNGALLPDAEELLEILGLIIVTTFANSSIVLFMVSFFNSLNAFSTASSIVGTIIGFLTGIYLPIGNLPTAVQLVIKVFPVSHAAVLFRQVMMEKQLAVTFAGAPAAYIAEFKSYMGVTFSFGNVTLTPVVSVLALIATIIVFYALAVWRLTKKVK